MVYRGTIKNGQVVLEESTKLPEGAHVRVEIENHVSESAPNPEQQLAEFWDSLREMAGTAKTLPPDIAENHDHYLYGRPKK
jgi:hypothetical protein